MPKRIGVISFYYNNFNYGGQLQAYALTKYLQKNGYVAEQISYKKGPNNSGLELKVGKTTFRKLCERIPHIVKAVIKRFFKIILRKEFCLRDKKFLEFQNDIPHSENVYTRDNIKDTNNIYDVFIAGSDQIWNFLWYNSEYFLDFVLSEKYKFSYAASMPVERLSCEEEKIISEHLKSFDDVSVREKSTAEKLNKLQDKAVKWVLDPTLILERKDWDEICSEPLIKEKYVFCYFLSDNYKIRKLAMDFAKKKGLRLVTLPHLCNIFFSDIFFKSIKLYDVSAREFISLIKNAEYVFTDSFHAAVFSNIYAVKHFVFSRKGYSMDERVHTLLEVFNAKERFCSGNERENLDYLLQISDLTVNTISEKFAEAQKASMEYLDKNLGCLN